MIQTSFTDFEYNRPRRKSRREKLLETMDALLPWEEWVAFISPHYPDGKRGRPAKGIETMLRMYLLQNWFNLSDKGIEEEICDSHAMRSFMGLDFNVEQVPDATTLLKFRHLMEKHGIDRKILADVENILDKKGLALQSGTVIDVSISRIPGFTKHKEQESDPERRKSSAMNPCHRTENF